MWPHLCCATGGMIVISALGTEGSMGFDDVPLPVFTMDSKLPLPCLGSTSIPMVLEGPSVLPIVDKLALLLTVGIAT